jgi:hypothetical protein
MDTLPPLSALIASLAGLVACLTIYLGAQRKSWIHKMAISAGVAVVLCISVLPYFLLMAFDNLGNETYETAFIAYFTVSAASAITALSFSLFLLWLRWRTAA